MSNWGWEVSTENISIIPMPMTPMPTRISNLAKNNANEKYLIYYTIGSDVKFIESLELSIRSLILFGKYNGDILIITDNICHEQVKNKFTDCDILNIDSDCIHCESSINKLKIYQYENIKNYDKIIYLDLDILIQNDINPIFTSIKNKFVFSNELQVSSNRIMKMADADGYGKHLFSEKEAYVYDIENRKAINGGFFGFDISMISHFEKILIDVEIDRIISKDKPVWYCEQATINKYMTVNNLYDDDIISDKVLTSASQYNYRDINLQDKIIIHFCWGVGNHDYKINYMKPWYAYLLEKTPAINTVKTRDECLLQIKNILPPNPVTCEIGFFRGEFSKLINDTLEPSKHYTIDFFEGDGFSGDKDGNNIQCQNMSEMKILSEKLGYNTIAGTSKTLEHVDEEFDFIYIDADHTYNWVSFDLQNAFNKIKNGGIIAGHDYSDSQFPECVAAVNDFCKHNNQQIFLLSEDGCPSFFIKINKE